MNWANRITMLRIGTIPIICGLVYVYTPAREDLRIGALALFIVAALSDWVDGYIARNWDQRSPLGARLDPMADKLLVNLAFVFVAANVHFAPGIPMWYPPVLIARDIFILGGAYIINEYYQPLNVKPRLTGKLATFINLAALIAALAQFPYTTWLVYAALALTVVSLLDYWQSNTGQFVRRESI